MQAKLFHARVCKILWTLESFTEDLAWIAILTMFQRNFFWLFVCICVVIEAL